MWDCGNEFGLIVWSDIWYTIKAGLVYYNNTHRYIIDNIIDVL